MNFLFKKNLIKMNYFYSILLIFLFDKTGAPAALLSGTLVASGILQISEIASYKFPEQSIDFCLCILNDMENTYLLFFY